MANDNPQLRYALTAAIDTLTLLHNALTEETVRNQAIFRAAKELDPKFEAVYQKFYSDQESHNTRKSRADIFGSTIRALQSIK